ncbi:hypothetical protein HSB1_10260 [Halogranum salarium B-1]|uniref:Tubulin/FtsZ GTPase domain-containing protein n=1 Tax=Halogranum salarium B-1 TaxID=1210908 RepID=J3A4M9_9EURY|nr:hypothetical protein HSB1_10260 [Halogranum salarium B-1]
MYKESTFEVGGKYSSAFFPSVSTEATRLQLALIGVGRIGGAIVDTVTSCDRLLGGGLVAGSVAVDTAPADLASLRAVPRSNRVTIGGAYPCRDGVDGDNEFGASITTEDIDAILAGVDGIPSHHADAFLVVAALGGGTGGGGAPVVARELRRLFSRPVYGLGVLPSRDTDTATAQRTVRSLVTFVREVDNLLLVDGTNGRRHADVSELAHQIAAVFGSAGATEVDEAIETNESDESHTGGESHEFDGDSEMPARIDDGDSLPVDSDPVGLESVLEVGGVSLLGHAAATSPQRGLVERVWNPTAQTPKPDDEETLRLVQAAAYGGIRTGRRTQTQNRNSTDTTTESPPVPQAQSAWVVTTGLQQQESQESGGSREPPGTLVDERSRRWLCDETNVRTVGGRRVTATDGSHSVTLLLAGVRDAPRLTDLWERAVHVGCGDPRDDPTRTSPETATERDKAFEPLF